MKNDRQSYTEPPSCGHVDQKAEVAVDEQLYYRLHSAVEPTQHNKSVEQFQLFLIFHHF